MTPIFEGHPAPPPHQNEAFFRSKQGSSKGGRYIDIHDTHTHTHFSPLFPMTFSPSERENVYEGSSIHLIKKIIKFDLPAMLTNSNSQDPPFVQFFFKWFIWFGFLGIVTWGAP